MKVKWVILGVVTLVISTLSIGVVFGGTSSTEGGFLELGGFAENVTEQSLEKFTGRPTTILKTGRISNGKIAQANILVTPQVGSSSVDFRSLLIQYKSDDVCKYLTIGYDDNTPMAYQNEEYLNTSNIEKNNYAVLKIIGENPPFLLKDSGSKAEIILNISAIEPDGGLHDGEKAKLIFLPEDGFKSQTQLEAPSYLSGGFVYL